MGPPGRGALAPGRLLAGRAPRSVPGGRAPRPPALAGLEPGARAARAAADATLADRIEAEGMDRFAVHWAAQPMFAALAGRADLDAMRRAQDPAGIAAALRGLGPAAIGPFWDRLGGVTVPGLFIAG